MRVFFRRSFLHLLVYSLSFAVLLCGCTQKSSLSGTLSVGANTLGSVSSGSPSTPSVPPVQPAPTGLTKSIRQFVSCSGSDESAGVAQAFAAAKNNAFTLIVDCTVKIHIGTNPSKTIFIDNGTSVFFSGGQFLIDNVFVPAFVVANSSNINLSNWNILYTEFNGTPVGDPFLGDTTNASNNFNDETLTSWLKSNRGVNFASGAHAVWEGHTNDSAVFYITGASSQISIKSLTLAVPPSANVTQFIPTVMSLGVNYKSNENVTTTTPGSSVYQAIPDHVTISNVNLDGILMGFQGACQYCTFEYVTSNRYGDLVSSPTGTDVGGAGYWFAPPHLFYLFQGANETDPGLSNLNITLQNIDDEGIRAYSGIRNGTGSSCSLKFGSTNGVVDTYISKRADGFATILSMANQQISNVTGSYDSSLQGWSALLLLGPADVYPGTLKFQNVSITDTASSATQTPIGIPTALIPGVTFTGTTLTLNNWKGSNPLPTTNYSVVTSSQLGTENTLSPFSLSYNLKNTNSVAAASYAGLSVVTLQATPMTINAGGTTTLSWTATNSSSCTASGNSAWSGSLNGSSKTVKLSTSGSYNFIVTCMNGSTSVSSAVTVQAN